MIKEALVLAARTFAVTLAVAGMAVTLLAISASMWPAQAGTIEPACTVLCRPTAGP